jgi:hypothetical protein
MNKTPNQPLFVAPRVDISRNRIDVDSELRNSQDKSFFLESENTRHTHPSYDVRGLNTPDLGLGYPLHDPQCQIFEPFQVNTRLQAKDNHKAVWQIPIDQTALMPPRNPERQRRCELELKCDYR